MYNNSVADLVKVCLLFTLDIFTYWMSITVKVSLHLTIKLRLFMYLLK